MPQGFVEITPATKVFDLLEAYPELEETLIGIAPPFKKLKNPILRKTVAKVATIKHISSVGGVPLNELLNKLRVVVGQSETHETYDDENYFTTKPEWFSSGKISFSIDEAKLEENDKMTVSIILRESRNVKKGDIIELITTFLPAPGIDLLKSKGFSVWTLRDNGLIKTYFLKKS